VTIGQVQDVIEVAVGGRRVTTTVEGRERYPVRVRYMRELRDSIETLGKILIPAADGAQIPLIQLAEIRYVRGPQAVKSEDTFLLGYVVFDKKPGYAEVEVVEQCLRYLDEKIAAGEFVVPKGVNYTFSGIAVAWSGGFLMIWLYAQPEDISSSTGSVGGGVPNIVSENLPILHGTTAALILRKIHSTGIITIMKTIAGVTLVGSKNEF
jgi:hypothetical protein